MEFRKSTITELPTVRKLRNNKAGRDKLVQLGLWSEENKNLYLPKDSANAPFIGWDGEGITQHSADCLPIILPNGKQSRQCKNCIHLYIMLCNSWGDVLYNAAGIPTLAAFEFLWGKTQEHGPAIHVAFGASYDINMILSDISYAQAQRLATSGVIHIGDWRIEHQVRRMFMLTRYRHKQRHLSSNRIGKSFVLWDAFGFFQARFTKALQAWGMDDVKSFANIVHMKDERSNFTLRKRKQIESYCIAECQALATMMEELREKCARLDLIPTRWDGAGALGTAMLKKEGIKQYMGTIPPNLQLPSQLAYFGGRIENVRFGNYEKPVWSHDIRSAYPHASTLLPCLAHGKWVHTKQVPEILPTTFAIVRVTLTGIAKRNFDIPIYPLPCRTPKGTIHFVQQVTGWYWAPEIYMALAHLQPELGQNLELHEAWIWEQKCKHRPFKFLQTYYRERKELIKQGDHAQLVLKLAMNSVYGKLAQRLGYEQHKKIPTYHQLEWGGWITSYTRAKMFDLAMRTIDAVIAFETDGLYATKQLAENGLGELGNWEVEEHEGITYVQSGFYFLKDNGIWTSKHRGFDLTTITRTAIITAWEKNKDYYVSGSSTRFRGFILSSKSPSLWEHWRQWVTDDDRRLDIYPMGKRDLTCEYYQTGKGKDYKPHKGLILTQARETWGVIEESLPHPLPWRTNIIYPANLNAWSYDLEDSEDYT